MEKLRSLAESLKDSLFFVPALIMVSCGALALFALYLDTQLSDSLKDTPVLLNATVAGGRSILTTVAGATITVAAIVFSITALSSQIAANQYSPRAVRGFFEDPFQQAVIGLIVGTFIYCLFILGSLSSSVAGTTEPEPSIALTLAVLLGVASVIGIVAYIDHSLKRFQVDSVIRRIADGTLAAVKRQQDNKGSNSVITESPAPAGEPTHVVSNRSGWIKRINASGMAVSLPEGSTVRVDVRLGEPISSGDQLATIWADETRLEGIATVVQQNITSEKERSLDIDPSFGIRQLVDIALRALSPGVNDPTTAVDVVHHLKVPVREILHSDPPGRVYHGSNGQRLYLPDTLSRSDFVHSAYAEIRLAAGSQPAVLHALLEVLGDLRSDLEGVNLSGRLSAIDEEWNLTIDAVLGSNLPSQDIQRVLAGREKSDVNT